MGFYSWTVNINIYGNYPNAESQYLSRSGTASVPQGSGYYANFDVPPTSITRPGYNFIGYAESAEGGVSVQPYDGYAVWFNGSGTKTVRLYCKWQLKSYTLSFDANGGTNAPAPQTKLHGTDLTITSDVPTRTNFIFQGWSTSSTGAVEYQPGDPFSIDDDTTLYAIWAVAAATLDTVSDTAIGSSGSASWTKVKNEHAYKLKLSFGNAPVVTVNVAANAASCSFTIPATWYNYIANATSAVATAVLETYTDANYTTLVGSTSKQFTVSVASGVKPTISALTATPHSQNLVAEGWGVAVQGYSYATIAVTATPGTGASISSIEISGPGINQAGSAASGNTGILTTTGTNTFTVTVTDSRGRTATQTVNLTVYEYSNPVVTSLEAVRCLSNGTISETEGNYIKAYPIFVYSSVNGHNSLSVKKIEYKKHTDSTWTTATSSAASGSWTSVFGPADISVTYDVRCTVTDALNNTYTLEVIVPPVLGFALGLENDRACFGGPCEEDGLVCKWDFKIKAGKTLKIGSTTLTEAQLQSLLNMI